MPSYGNPNRNQTIAPAQVTYLTAPAQIRKDQIGRLCKLDIGVEQPGNLVGCLNSAPYVIGEVEHAPRSLAYDGFKSVGATGQGGVFKWRASRDRHYRGCAGRAALGRRKYGVAARGKPD